MRQANSFAASARSSRARPRSCAGFSAIRSPGSRRARSPRQLNLEGVPAPRGGNWNASTINGSKKRGNGILRQHLYAGRLIWNRQHFVKNPDTGKRITRVNANSELHFVDVPQLRIIEQADWQRVQKIMAGKSSGYAAPAKRKPPHLFTGLMKCGRCGRSYVSAGGSAWPRFICGGTASCSPRASLVANAKLLRNWRIEKQAQNRLEIPYAGPR